MVGVIQHNLVLEIQHLTKKYPKSRTRAVDDLSFSVSKGEIFGLLGPNGAGKTTAVGILTTCVTPTSGKALIMGINVADDPVGVKQWIAVVPQRNNLDRSLNARDILTFHASYHGIHRTVREIRADQLLAEFGLADHAKEMLNHYSSGMVQRVMFARALMHSPSILFLDEPTNNLDPQTRFFLWERMQTLRDQGMTILLTTHDMEEANRLCDRIAIMDHGKLLVLNTPAALKRLVPGGTVLELHLCFPDGETDGTASRAWFTQKSQFLGLLAKFPDTLKIEEVRCGSDQNPLMNEVKLLVYAKNASTLMSDVMQLINASSVHISDLHLSHANLEDVFISFTGRNLRS